jgi:hypothetical protein
MLQDAIKLAPVISEGIAGNLIGSNPAPGLFTSTGSTVGLIDQFIFGDSVFGCNSYPQLPGDGFFQVGGRVAAGVRGREIERGSMGAVAKQ